MAAEAAPASIPRQAEEIKERSVGLKIWGFIILGLGFEPTLYIEGRFALFTVVLTQRQVRF